MKTIVVLRCGELRCALDRAAVSEITPLPELTHPPSLPASLEGVMNLGGEAVVVVALGRLLGVEASEEIDPLYRHVVVLAGEAAGFGLLVDRVENVGVIDEGAVTPASRENSLNACVNGQIEFGVGMVHLLDSERLFLAAEQVRFVDIRKAEQARLDALQPT